MKPNSLPSRYKELYFKDPGLWEIFRELHKAGADLDYVTFLCIILWCVDCRDLVQEQAKKPQTVEAIVSPLIESLEPWSKIYSSRLVKSAVRKVIENLKLKSMVDPSVDLSSLRLLSRQEERRLIRDTWLSVVKGFLNFFIVERKSFLEDQQARASLIVKELPFIPVLIKYIKPPRRGQHSDDLGSLFLLAITEHVYQRSMRGGRGKKDYRTAFALLKKVRDTEAEARKRIRKRALPKSLRVTAKSRVAANMRVVRLKHSHSDWRSDLRLLEGSFHRFKSSLADN